MKKKKAAPMPMMPYGDAYASAPAAPPVPPTPKLKKKKKKSKKKFF